MTTPAQHVSVLLQQSIAALNIRPDGVYVDATFGRGGHSRDILAALSAAGRLVAFDRDPEAVAAAAALRDPRLSIHHAPFSRLSEVLAAAGIDRVDGVLLDLGVSSPQLDTAARGFSFRFDGVLDMRMDTSRGMTAADWISTATEAELADVIFAFGEERYARRIARAIVNARSQAPIATTGRLAEVVAAAVPRREPGQHPATRTFQAVRIHINGELDQLTDVLPQAVDRLAPCGRLAVISFHSLEDRIVKRFMRNARQADRLPARLPVRAAELPSPRLVPVGRAIRPDAAEVAANPRARSAVLRVAERTAAA